MPILLIVFGYSFSESVTLSLYAVMGNALAQSCINIRKVHPTSLTSPLIFWELVIILLPAQMGGSNIGSILSKIFPISIMYIVALIVLLYASTVSLRKGLHKWHDESEMKSKIHRESEVAKNQYNAEVSGRMEAGGGAEATNKSEVISPLATVAGTGVATVTNTNRIARFSVSHSDSVLDIPGADKQRKLLTNDTDSSHDGDEQTRPSLAMEAVRSLSTMSLPSRVMEVPNVVHPQYVLMAIATIWVVYLSLVIGLAVVNKCSAAYVAIFIVMYIPVLTAIAWGVYYNASIAPTLMPKGFDSPPPPANSLDLATNGATLSAFSFLIGVICSLLGIGGGELYGPLMLTYGVIPQVSSATTSMLSLLNTTVNVIRSNVEGGSDAETGMILFAIGVLGGCVGRQLGLYVSSRYGRPSVIILALVAALYLSCVYYVFKLGSSPFDSAVGSFC